MNERLTLQDLIDILAKKQDITKKDAEIFLRELIAVISENIENNEPVKIKDFGTFKLVKVNARRSVDVNTGEAIEIPAHYKLNFTPDKLLKEAINRPFSHFESVVLEEGVSFDNLEDKEDIEVDDGNEDAEAIVEDKAQEEIVPVIPPTIIPTEQQEDIQENIEQREPDAIVESIIEEEVVQKEEAIVEIVEEEVPEVEIVRQEPEVQPSQEADIPKEEIPEQPEGEAVVHKDFVPKVARKLDEVSETESEKMFGEHERKTKRRRFISLGFILLLIIAGFAVGGLYLQEIMSFFSQNPTEDKSRNVIDLRQKTEADSVKIVVSAADSLSAEVKEEPKNNVKDILPLATETIKSGQTLRLISLKYYGNRSFWPYIYEENKSIIKNPNNVPLGTQLVIPSPEKYGIDAKDSESVTKARALEEKLIKEMSL